MKFLILILITTFSLVAQTKLTSYQTSDTNKLSMHNFRAFCTKSNGDVLVLGERISSSTLYQAERVPFLATLTEAGTLINPTFYSRSFVNESSQIVPLADGFLILSSFEGDGFLMKLDPDYGVLWAIQLGDQGTGYESLKQVKLLEDGSFLCVGSSESYTSNGASALFLAKVDANGALIWSKNYTTGGAIYGVDVCELNQSYYALGYGTSLQNAHLLPVLFKINQEGTLMTSRSFQSDGMAAYSSSLLKHPSLDQFLITATQLSNAVDKNTSKSNLILIQIDTLMDVKWTKRYMSSHYDKYLGATATSDAYVIHQLSDFDTSYRSWNYLNQPTFSILKVALDGTIQNTFKQFNPLTTQHMISTSWGSSNSNPLLLNDGNWFYANTIHPKTDWRKTSILISKFKFESLGCKEDFPMQEVPTFTEFHDLTSTTQILSGGTKSPFNVDFISNTNLNSLAFNPTSWCEWTSVEEKNDENVLSEIYPNPVSSILNLKLSSDVKEIKIINILGSIVYESALNTLSIDVQFLSSGYYYLIGYGAEHLPLIQDRFIKY